MELSIILGVVGVSGQIIASRNALAGWIISLAAQPLWYAFTITTGQYGLLLLNTGYAIAAILNTRRALADRNLTLTALPSHAIRSARARVRVYLSAR